MKQKPFDGDRPIAGESDDRLGFTIMARHLADAVVKLSSPQGFVIGVEGAWGAGKSSFVNVAIQALKALKPSPAVIQFSPWLISSRDGLLKELFAELLKVTQEVDLGADASAADRKKRLRSSLKQYSKHLEAAGRVAGAIGDSGIPWTSGFGLFRRGERLLNEWLTDGSLEDQKAQLGRELALLPNKIVVFVDDLDRLEPAETGEVLRLVRAVADFPNIVYVLCYSREVLAHNLGKAFDLSQERGNDYIDKIVQTSFLIPRPEAFDLRRMFRRDVEAAFPHLFGPKLTLSGRQVLERLDIAIDVDGGKSLITPRHVVRAVNAIRLYLGPIVDAVDIADMSWLQLVRLRSLPLYQWIERYMSEVAALANGASISDEDKRAHLEELTSILSRDGASTEKALQKRLYGLASYLPGIKAKLGGGADLPWQLYEDLSENTMADAIVNRRLASPQHYRYYFALAQPSGSISDESFRALIRTCEGNPESAAAEFVAMAAEGVPGADALLNRLHGSGLLSVPKGALPGLLLAIGRGMDVAASKQGEGDWGELWVWRRAEKVLQNALPLLNRKAREELVAQLVKTAALGWLTKVFRTEIFAHGVYGDRPKPSNERIFTPEEFDVVKATMVQRYSLLNARELANIPHSVHILYAWVQSGTDPEAVKEWLQERLKDNADFLTALETWRSWRATNGRVHHPLSKSVISRFLDFAATKQRLLSLSAAPIPAIAERARALLDVLEEDEE